MDVIVGQTSFSMCSTTRSVPRKWLTNGAFAGLSADQRAVIALHYGADLSIRDAAESMGVAIGTAKSRLNTALRRLRKAVEGQP